MAERGSFSIASVILSYFLVAGGVAIGLIGMTLLKTGSEGMLYLSLAVGGFLGGFVAAQASRGSTIMEPAIGGILVILTIVGIFVGTTIGEFIWHIGKAKIGQTVAIAGVSAAVGAVAGALVSEKVFGSHTQSSLPWLIYVGLAILGSCFVAFILLLGVLMRGKTGEGVTAGTWFGAVALGCFLSGLTTGASAPKRILFMNLLGGVAGIMGFYLLIRAIPGVSSSGEEGKVAAGFAIIGVGGGILALLGAAIGWAAVGKKAARG